MSSGRTQGGQVWSQATSMRITGAVYGKIKCETEEFFKAPGSTCPLMVCKGLEPEHSSAAAEMMLVHPVSAVGIRTLQRGACVKRSYSGYSCG
jgi:hypothetical protein